MAQKQKNPGVKVLVRQIKMVGKKKKKSAVLAKERPVDSVLANKPKKKTVKPSGPVFLRVTKGQSIAQSPHLVDLKASEKEALVQARWEDRERSVKPRNWLWFRFKRPSKAPQFLPARFNFNLRPARITKKVDNWLVKGVQQLGFFLWKAYKSFPHFFSWFWSYLIGWTRVRPKIKLGIKPKIGFKPAPRAKLKFQHPTAWYRPIIGFVLAGFLLVMPIWALTYYQKLNQTSQEVIGITQMALERLKSGGVASMDFDLNSASQDFNAAWQGFDFAQEQLDQTNQVVLEILKLMPHEGRMVSAGEKLLLVGKDIALAGQYLSAGLEPIMDQGKVDLSNVMVLPAEAAVLGELPLTEKIANLKNNFLLASAKIRSAQENLSAVKINSLPKEYQATLSQAGQSLSAIQKKTGAFVSFVDFLNDFLGQKQAKRYLLIFQNNAELRATGGFIGSLALVDIDQGQIKNMEIPGGGPYDLKAGFFQNVIAPEPLHLVNPRWELQDANWFPDFPASAEKIIWFYNQAGGPSVDGVIALTPELIEQLVALVGPIDMQEKYGATITAENFIPITQAEAEKKYDETKTSKQFIADLATPVLAKVLAGTSQDYLKILAVLNQSLAEKSLLFYFANSDLEKQAIDYGWAGQMKESPADYLAIIHSNIAGGKTDLVMSETVEHLAEVADDGSIIDTLTITRKNNGIKDDPFTGYKNVDYLRVYVPQGSELVSATGFAKPAESYFLPVPEHYQADNDLTRIETAVKIDNSSQTRISNEFGKTAFGNWVQTDLGEITVVILKYRLPFKLPLAELRQPETWWDNLKREMGLPEPMASYSILIQKQPGSQANQFNHQLKFQFNPQVVWQYPAEYKKNNDGWQMAGKIDGDKFFGLVFKD